MEPTEKEVLEAVKRNEPTTPSEIANSMCDGTGTPKEISDRYDRIEENIRSLMVKMVDNGRLRVGLDWKFRTCDNQTFKDKVLKLLH